MIHKTNHTRSFRPHLNRCKMHQSGNPPRRQVLEGDFLAAERLLRLAHRERESIRPNFRSIHYFSEEAVAKALKLILELGIGRTVNDVSRNCFLVIWDSVNGPTLNGNPEEWDVLCTNLSRADVLLRNAHLLMSQARSTLG